MDFALSKSTGCSRTWSPTSSRDELMPLEAGVLAREAEGKGLAIDPAEHKRLDEVSTTLGLWGLDAPEDVGGVDLPAVAMVGRQRGAGHRRSPPTPCRPTARTCAC